MSYTLKQRYSSLFLFLLLPLTVLGAGCGKQNTPESSSTDSNYAASSESQQSPEQQSGTAEVLAVEARGNPGNYTFSVTVSSPDTGCEQYADWWEVVSEEGELIYRRVLLHSHVEEQPFQRSGSPVEIQPDETVWVRVHMNSDGYSNQAQKGTVAGGFEAATAPEGFASELAEEEPLPSGCQY